MLTLLLFFGSAAFLAWFLVHGDRGAKEPAGALWGAFGFGALGFVMALILETPLGSVDHAIRTGGITLGGMFLFALAIGFIEEMSKFIPLAAFIRDRQYFNEHTDGVIYFALSGLAFSLLENLGYLASYGSSTGLLRVFLLLFFHAATSGIVGYYYAKSKLEHESLLKTGLALVGVAVLHGVYDFGLFTQQAIFIYLSLMLTALLNTGLFLYYHQGKELDEQMGLAAVGDNHYCRNCGWPNPKHMLYCEHCGSKA